MVYVEFGISGIAKHIAASGYAIYALDHPGFGLSDGLHGYIPSFDELADNVIEMYTKIKGATFKTTLRISITISEIASLLDLVNSIDKTVFLIVFYVSIGRKT
jgi:pimeloyl-ACP methyl ester carboxylesterase